MKDKTKKVLTGIGIIGGSILLLSSFGGAQPQEQIGFGGGQSDIGGEPNYTTVSDTPQLPMFSLDMTSPTYSDPFGSSILDTEINATSKKSAKEINRDVVRSSGGSGQSDFSGIDVFRNDSGQIIGGQSDVASLTAEGTKKAINSAPLPNMSTPSGNVYSPPPINFSPVTRNYSSESRNYSSVTKKKEKEKNYSSEK